MNKNAFPGRALGAAAALLAFVAVALAVVVAVPTPALAESISRDWNVKFTSADKMESTFATNQIDDVVNGLQPGDDVTFKLALENQNPVTTDWYMENKVLSSLERSQAVAQKGAYSYRLVYTGPTGTENVLYDSEGIGGDKEQRIGKGLEEATDSLDEMFYLDTLATGQKGRIDLRVALEGETQGNSYQNTQADLRMNFAVEKRSGTSTTTPGSPTPSPSIPRPGGLLPVTGDPTSYIPLVGMAAAAGVALLAVAFLIWNKRDKQAEEGGR